MSQESHQPKVCRIFASGQPCRFGSNCRYFHPQPSEGDRPTQGYRGKTKICRSYTETRFCKFGARCRYLHPQLRPSHNPNITRNQNTVIGEENTSETTQTQQDEELALSEPYHAVPLPNSGRRDEISVDVKASSTGKYDESSNQSHDKSNAGSQQNASKCSDVNVPDGKKGNPRKNPRKRLCRYFKAGDCYRGDRCKFWHPEIKDPLLDGCSTAPASRSEKIYQKRQVYNPTQVALDELTEDQQKELKTTEVSQLLKRYPKSRKTDHDDGSVTAEFMFVPSDPDWPYDVKKISLKVTFPDEYPLEAMSASLSDNQELDLPEVVIRHIDRSVKDWVTERFQTMEDQGQAELMFRPWLKWLDRSLEEIMTVALRHYKRNLMAEAAGVQFIPAKQLQQQYTGGSGSDTGASVDSDAETDEDSWSGSEGSEEETDSDSDEYDPDEVPPQPSNSGEMPPESGNNPQDMSAVRRGTEVKLRDLQLLENACTLMAKKVKVVIMCDRCKNKSDVTLSSQKPSQVICIKCSQDMVVAYRPSMAHQFSAIIGYLDVHHCQGFDLVLLDCAFNVGCFNCNREVVIEGLHPGEPKELFCRHCHKKMKIIAQSVRLQQLQSSNEIDISAIQIEESKKKKKLPKDPAIQEGKPLPYEGTCKHYKKSYRWFRFPCCGKAYPCDVCHEEQESDHEMIFANRMICGFCCKEQIYSGDRPCVSCGYSLVKMYSSHWEGGKGCRDKIKMSRDDKKKYSNMGKSQSRKSQAKQSSKGKKTTKLRHT